MQEVREVKSVKCVCIPVERYERMLDTYDKVVEELEALKQELEAYKKGVAV